MHLLPRDIHGLDDAGAAVDLGQSPAKIVFLSFSDSELCLLARLYERDASSFASLRCASLAQLKHPYSVDLYVENVARHARLVVVRLLGGKEYWSYGVEQIETAARAHGFALAVVPGDGHDDPRLARASTLPAGELARLWSWFQDGGADNLRSFLGYASTFVGKPAPWRDSAPLAKAGECAAAQRPAATGAPRALIVFYRSMQLAGDIAPILALADALSLRGFAVEAVFVASLKDAESEAFVARTIEMFAPDAILNATAFSARGDKGSILNRANAPVFQVALATSTRDAWEKSARGANGADLAMNVVLPEVDGRIFTRAISFKETAPSPLASEFAQVRHAPDSSRVEFVADLAVNWARLRRTPNGDKRLALVLSDYPARRGRGGYAIGLDAEASAFSIIEALEGAGYEIGADGAYPYPACGRGWPREAGSGEGAGPHPSSLRDDTFSREREKGRQRPAFIRLLEDAAFAATLPLTDYGRLFAALPARVRESVAAAWGAPQDDPAVRGGAFRFSCLEAGKLVVAFQPDRGSRADRRETYHDADAPPRHAYLAFYLWLRHVSRIDALIHLGTHGTLEWLPGKSAMLSQDCVVEAALGPTPLVYPFIVNDPGEAAQAKRRAGAVTIGHMTPPLAEAGLSGAAAQIETLLDEYANAASLDPRRARLIAGAILDEAERSGLAAECGLKRDADIAEQLARLDAWLCDVNEMRVGDGLHVFGRGPHGAAEMRALLAALDGRFVEPGPGGAPSRGRADVLPTGRNLYCIDPRQAPTRTACDIGRRAALEAMTRHAQEHGDYPRAILLDLWGSATIRTGGEDFAQALALIGVSPVWDDASARVVGFEIEPQARRDLPRVDVTLHVSGLFRDMFPGLVALFHDAARAVASLDEDAAFNPLTLAGADAQRVFGAASGSYGLGVAEKIARGEWASRDELGAAFLDAAGHALDRDGDTAPARGAFAERVAKADALLHAQDMAETDVLAGAAFAEFEGGFAAANRALGGEAALLHLDATAPDRLRVRPLREEIARVVRARVANPRWIKGQMRHGHRGAGEIAEAIDNLYAFAATAGLVGDAQFDLAFSATLGNETVRKFLIERNPRAAAAIAHVFEEALRRDLWRTRRNSVAAALATTKERADERRA